MKQKETLDNKKKQIRKKDLSYFQRFCQQEN